LVWVKKKKISGLEVKEKGVDLGLGLVSFSLIMMMKQ
jgi:hypothetical protein